ncbi:MAG: ATP-binding cassette domain-containing protein [Rectinemataceae bacterium]|jgi:simple sugar transport system ATP-binding protein
MENISVRYGKAIALDGVNFQIGRKEIVGLIGDNGAGKTTLVNTLTGYCKPYEGKIYLDGQLVSFRSPKEAQRSGIETKYQGSSLIETMSIANNFFLGREPYRHAAFFGKELRHPRFVDRKKMNEVLHQEMDRLRIRGVNYFDDYPGMLSGGQKEAITIARALYFGVRLLILDEPTTALSEEETSIVLNLVRKAKQNGLSVVFITHKADEVFQVADRFVVLRNGRNFANVEKGSIDLRQLETLDMYARLTAIKELSSSLAHQISTPLTVMKLSVEMLQDNFSVTARKDEYEKITAMLIRKIEALQYMAKNLLDYVRPLMFKKENVHVGELIAAVLEDMPMKDFNDVRIDASGVDQTLLYPLDRNLIHAALSNLALNALQSSPPHASVEVRAALYKGRLHIEIQDHGKGMDEETRENVFNFFFTTREAGTGLGLPFVHRIVEKHEGSLDIESTPGQGCTVRIEL